MVKAIGKGSLASILAVGLHIIRVILYIAIAGLGIAALALPLADVIAAVVESWDNVNVSADIDVSADDYFDVFGGFIVVGVMIFVINRLLEILRTLRFGDPFEKENADRFRAVGYALLIGESAKLVLAAVAAANQVQVDFDFDLSAWGAVIAVFVLSEVFREGARMKEEQELTV